MKPIQQKHNPPPAKPQTQSQSASAHAIEKRAQNEETLAVREPEYLQAKQMPRGGEEVDKTDLIVPRLSLAQKMSDEIDESSPKYIPGLKEGMFFNNISKTIYGVKVQVVPVFKFASRVRWESREKGSPVICQSVDGKTGIGDPGGTCATCPCAQFQDGEPPECTEFKNMGLVVLPKHGKPTMSDAAVLPFKRGSLPEGKQWITMLNMTGRDYFSFIFDLTSAQKPGKKGKFWVPTATYVGERTDCSAPKNLALPPSRTDLEMYKIGESTYSSLKNLYGRAKEEGRQVFDVAGEEIEPGASDESNA